MKFKVNDIVKLKDSDELAYVVLVNETDKFYMVEGISGRFYQVSEDELCEP